MSLCDFHQWRKTFVEDLESATDRFRFNPGADSGQDYEKTQQELVKILMSKHRQRFMQFIKQLSDETSDREVKDLADRLETDRSARPNWKPSHRISNDDIIVPPMADRGIDPNSVD